MMRSKTTTRRNDENRALRNHIEDRLARALGRFEHRIHRVEVYLEDVNGPRGGLDKQVRVVVQLRPTGHVVVSGMDTSGYAAVADVVQRVKNAVRRALRRRKARRLRPVRLLEKDRRHGPAPVTSGI